MKLTRFFRAAALCSLLVAALTGCSKDDDYIHGDAEMPDNTVVMAIKDFVYEDVATRTTYEPTKKGLHTHWAEEDIVGVLPEEGTQNYAIMKDFAGKDAAVFDSKKLALMPSSYYIGYYPMRKNSELDKTAYRVHYPTEYIQHGYNSAEHLAAYDYLLAKAERTESNSVHFDFAHLGCLVELRVKMPEDGAIETIALSGDKPWYITDGEIDLTTNIPLIDVSDMESIVELEVMGAKEISAGDILIFYLMMAPTTIENRQVKVNCAGYKGVYLPAVKLEGGHAYRINIALEKPVPSGFVDLGVSVLWAEYNVGAESPEDYGSYFAWGETRPKSRFDESNSLTFEKNGPWDSGFAGNAQYDAATANWGAPWRMPTNAEMEELVNKCDRTWTTQGGVNGYLIRGRGAYSGNTIFLPAAGYRNGTSLGNAGSDGNYWSATPIESYANFACYLRFNSSNFFTNWNGRYYGLTVRPVQEK